MRTRLALAALAALLALGTSCSSERLVLDLTVAVAPNPVAGVNERGERRWSYTISIANSAPVGVFIESYHKEIRDTDTGYSQPLLLVRDAEFLGRYIRSGEVFSFPVTERTVGASFRRGTERRIYHTRGDDGRFYSGEVYIDLQ